MKNIFRKKHIKDRGMYFVASGERVGAFLVHINEFDTETAYLFLEMPNFSKVSILKSDILEMLKNDELRFVQKIKRYAYDVCLKQFKHLK